MSFFERLQEMHIDQLEQLLERVKDSDGVIKDMVEEEINARLEAQGEAWHMHILDRIRRKKLINNLIYYSCWLFLFGLLALCYYAIRYLIFYL